MTAQTKDILAQIDGFLAKAGTDKSKAAVGQHLGHRHEGVRRDERGLGRLGVARQHARPRHGRGRLASPDYKVEIMVVAGR
jgi:enamine deaminase RidA (YjgF/YER057c/UK114 family)